jgi:hypothetical protein
MKWVPAIAIAVGSVLLSAQSPISFSPEVETALNGFAKGAYLEANDALEALAFAPDGQVRDPMAFAIWTQFNPFLTNELDPNVRARSGRASKPDPTWALRIAAANPRDAIEEIVARARKTNIVILNEAHSSPRDRAFALRVARALRPLGFKTLALETLDNNERENVLSASDQLKRDGFVRFNTGSYTRDPVFARFLREALALGYEPVAYEQTKSQDPPNSGIPEREQAQAENLMRNIFSAHPKKKVLIYVGHAHVAENPLVSSSGKRSEWMAARLKRMTGVDPLTIDQTSVVDYSSGVRDAYDAAASRISRSPTVFFEGANALVLGQYAGSVDLQVVHPRRSYHSGRPSWLVELGGKRVPIPRHLTSAKNRRLIQAFAANAPSDAVPLDQVLVNGPSSNPVLIVPDEPVRFAIQE